MSIALPALTAAHGRSRALVSGLALVQIASHAAREVPGVDYLAAPGAADGIGTRVELVAGGATMVSVQIVVRTAVGLLEAASAVRENVRAALSHMAGLAGDIIVDVHVVDVDTVDLDPAAGSRPGWPALDEVASALTGLVDDAATVLLEAARLGAEALTDTTARTSWSQPPPGDGRARATRTGSHCLGLIWPQAHHPTEGSP